MISGYMFDQCKLTSGEPSSPPKLSIASFISPSSELSLNLTSYFLMKPLQIIYHDPRVAFPCMPPSYSASESEPPSPESDGGSIVRKFSSNS